jgi:nucleoside-diphosphate-sugar epimerase
MRVVVTGSAGHLGEGLVRTLRRKGTDVLGADRLPSPFTDAVGSVADRAFVRACLEGAGAVLHAATLHKPHVGTHSKQEFVDTNVTGTLNVLEEAVAAGVSRVVFTSTTSAFGDALTPPPGAPAAWITEAVAPAAKNVYGATKTAAEDLCSLVHREHGLPVVVLRTSRFFPEADDRDDRRAAFADANLKVNELLYRRADLQDVVDAHLRALDRAPGDRLRPLRRERDDPVHPGRSRGAAGGRAGRRATPRAGARGGLRRAGMADAPVDRPRVRQRAGA